MKETKQEHGAVLNWNRKQKSSSAGSNHELLIRKIVLLSVALMQTNKGRKFRRVFRQSNAFALQIRHVFFQSVVMF